MESVLRRQEPPPRGTSGELRILASTMVRAPPKRASGELCFPLTKTYMESATRTASSNGLPEGRSKSLHNCILDSTWGDGGTVAGGSTPIESANPSLLYFGRPVRRWNTSLTYIQGAVTWRPWKTTCTEADEDPPLFPNHVAPPALSVVDDDLLVIRENPDSLVSVLDPFPVCLCRLFLIEVSG